jgi:hypothetical protein
MFNSALDVEKSSVLVVPSLHLSMDLLQILGEGG